jgi:hypothetical protein
MKRVILSLFIAFSCFRIYARDIVDNLDMFLSTKYINSSKLAHNVPVVNDGLTARIRTLRSKDQGWQTVLE